MHHTSWGLLDVHLMLLRDEALVDGGVKSWITERLYNAEWALTTQLGNRLRANSTRWRTSTCVNARPTWNRSSKRILRAMKVTTPPSPSTLRATARRLSQQTCCWTTPSMFPLVLIAHDLSPADMLQFKQSVFAGSSPTWVAKTSHTAIVARSMDIPAVVGARLASQLVRQDDWVIIDGDAGVVIVILAHHPGRIRLRNASANWNAGVCSATAAYGGSHPGWRAVELLANIRSRRRPIALKAGAVGVGLLHRQFPVHGAPGSAPR